MLVEILLMHHKVGAAMVRWWGADKRGSVTAFECSCQWWPVMQFPVGFRPRSQIPLYIPGFHSAELRGAHSATSMAGRLKTWFPSWSAWPVFLSFKHTHTQAHTHAHTTTSIHWLCVCVFVCVWLTLEQGGKQQFPRLSFYLSMEFINEATTETDETQIHVP